MRNWIDALLVPTLGLLFVAAVVYGVLWLVATLGAIHTARRGLPSYWRCDRCGNHVPSGQECPYGCPQQGGPYTAGTL